MEDYMIKNEALNKSSTCSKTKKGAKLARLSYEVIGKYKDENMSIVNDKAPYRCHYYYY